MKLKRDPICNCRRVMVTFVILILKFNYGFCHQETGDNSDALSTADSAHNDIMLNDETYKFYDNVDELAANLFNDTVTEYPNDEEDIGEESLKKLMESYDKTYTNETWLVVPKDSDIVETIHDIVEEFETRPIEEIVIVTQDDDNVSVSQRQHDDLQFGLENLSETTEIVVDTTFENKRNENDNEIEQVNSFDVRSDELEDQTTEIGEVKYRNEEPEFSTESEIRDDVNSNEFEVQTSTVKDIELGNFKTRDEDQDSEVRNEDSDQTTSTDAFEYRNEFLETTSIKPEPEKEQQSEHLETTEKDDELSYKNDQFETETTELTEISRNSTSLDENDDLLIDELEPVVVEITKPSAIDPVYEDYTTEEETTTQLSFIDDIIGNKMYVDESESTFDNTEIIPLESTSLKPVLEQEVLPNIENSDYVETSTKPSILQKISTYMYGIFNYRFGEGRNLELEPYDFSTEIFDDFVTTGYDTDRKRVEEQSIIEIEKILDPEVKNEFINDIVVDKSPELQSVFQKPDESNIANRGLVDANTDNVDVDKFMFDKINRDVKSTIEYEEEIIDNNLYSNPVKNSWINHVDLTKPEDKTISEIEKISDPDVQNEFIKDIPPSTDHSVDEVPVIETIKVIDNIYGDTETHMTERNIDENARHIHDENKVRSIETPDAREVTHEHVHIEQANDTLTEDHTKVEIETTDVSRIEVQHVTHEESEENVHTEKKTEHVTIDDQKGLHMENHETVETTKTKDGIVTDTEDIITKDLDNVHVVEKIKLHENNKNVYDKLLKKEEEIKKNKNKIEELKKEIDILKEDIKRPNELIAYEAEVLKKKGYLPDKLELIADYLNMREQQLHGDTDKYGLKRYLQRLTKERELDILKTKKDKLKKQLVEHFKEFMDTEQKFGIKMDDEFEKSIEKFDGQSKSSSSSSKSKSKSSSEQDDSKEDSEEQTWKNFINQARLSAQERVQQREREVKMLQHILNDDSTPAILLDHITLTPMIATTSVPVLFPDVDKESQIILLETLVRLPTIEKEKDLNSIPLTTELPITTDVPITEEISIEIDEIEKIVDDQSHIVKVIDKRVLLHNGNNNLEIDEIINTQNGDGEIEEHNRRIQKIDDKTRSRIIEVLMPKLREKSLKKFNLTRQGQGRSLSDAQSIEEIEEEQTDSPILELDDEVDSVITNEALRTVVEGVELTSEIARSVDNFRTPIEKINEILIEANQTVKTKTPNELADEIGRAEEILGIEENKIVAEIEELELVGVNIALVLFCILCTFLILIITIIFFLRKSKRFGGLNFMPV